MTVTRFFLFRHDTPDNSDDICYGEDMSVRFSDRAVYEGQLKQLPQDLVWIASPLPRTMQTASKMIQTRLGQNPQSISIIQRPGLREQLFGAWVGTTRSALAKDTTFEAYMSDPVNIPPPGGENLMNFSARVRQDFNDIASVHGGRNIAVFTHAGVIRAQAAEAKSIDILEAVKLPVSPLSLTIITHDSEKKVHGKNPWTLEALNLKP